MYSYRSDQSQSTDKNLIHPSRSENIFMETKQKEDRLRQYRSACLSYPVILIHCPVIAADVTGLYTVHYVHIDEI